ncbi:hypothetical protein ACH40E_18430 [Streptomyces acidicola]|uniref:hypothetical protein n=1 Tax=Streptomyces acidicola TaxID=2596892 RepID=UPI003795A417
MRHRVPPHPGTDRCAPDALCSPLRGTAAEALSIGAGADQRVHGVLVETAARDYPYVRQSGRIKKSPRP